MKWLIFNNNGSLAGESIVPYSSDDGQKTEIGVRENELTKLFQNVSNEYDTLNGTEVTPADAAENPFEYTDFLTLIDGSIEFNHDYVRD